MGRRLRSARADGGDQPGGAGQLEQSSPADELWLIDGLVKRWRLLHGGHDTEDHVDRGAKAAAIQFPQSHQFRGRPRQRFANSRMPIAEGAVFAGYTIVRLLGTGEWARSISCSTHGCLVKRR